ncbi:hypothetical protein LTR66_016574 [Elasticomyces elasticus]|nr:hypothetical protein LTR66_016574 [Elasticomyces elasticus]
MPPPLLETQNSSSKVEGPEYTFQTGEGTYILREDLQLATPPPHPSETPVNNANPLATTATPPTSGVKLSIVILNPKQLRPQLPKTASTTSNLLRWRGLGKQDNKLKDVREAKDSDLNGETASIKSVGNESTASLPSNDGRMFGEGNVALTQTMSRDVLKRRKPKNNMVKSNSSFISRVITHDQLSKRLAERDPGGAYCFVNVNRAFQWLDLHSGPRAEPLTKILFTKAHILSHDVNQLTKDESHIDVVMGSSASDILWYEPISQKYARINKNGTINSTPVAKIKWIPGSENLFLAAHQDGSLVVYDKEKEDAPFTPEDTVDEAISIDDLDESVLNITKSVNSANQKANPVAVWRLASQPITDFAFSPKNRHLAVVAEDGYLRVIDYLKETLTDVFSSYYGAFSCVCWSPDSKYILTGGQDALLSLWSLQDRALVARCRGHDSWVTGIAFDPWRCDDKNYGFGSVGDDCKLLLWDFNVGMLSRPKGTISKTRGSIGGQSLSLFRHRTESTTKLNRLRSDSNRTGQEPSPDEEEGPEFMKHSVDSRLRVAQLPPIMAKAVDEEPLCAIHFEQDYIVTTCTSGHFRIWDRPGKGDNDSEKAEMSA